MLLSVVCFDIKKIGIRSQEVSKNNHSVPLAFIYSKKSLIIVELFELADLISVVDSLIAII